MEKAAFFQLNKHLLNHGLYDCNQSGYKQHHSCETTLIEIVDDIQETIFRKNLIAVLMLDLSVVFDTVHQNKLLRNLL